MNDILMKVSIPPDDDGFVLFKCPICGTYFRLHAVDVEDDGVLSISCPSCGLISKNYLTEDVYDRARAMAENTALELLTKEIDKLSKSLKGSGIKIIQKGKPEKAYEKPITAGVDALVIKTYRCCRKEAKIKLLLKICGSYCPFCGVKDYEA